MLITDEIVNHIAHLARLEFEGDRKQTIKNDMEKIVRFMGKLSEVNTEEVEPLIFMSTEVNVLREDSNKWTLLPGDSLVYFSLLFYRLRFCLLVLKLC